MKDGGTNNLRRRIYQRKGGKDSGKYGQKGSGCYYIFARGGMRGRGVVIYRNIQFACA